MLDHYVAYRTAVMCNERKPEREMRSMIHTARALRMGMACFMAHRLTIPLALRSVRLGLHAGRRATRREKQKEVGPKAKRESRRDEKPKKPRWQMRETEIPDHVPDQT